MKLAILPSTNYGKKSEYLTELKWGKESSNYKVIFIAGNEDFLQGDITFSKACSQANSNGVIVNTIFRGDKMQGIPTLPDSLKNKSRAELKLIVEEKNNQRVQIQKQIAITSKKREKYIAKVRAQSLPDNSNTTLETEIEKIIQKQAKPFNMIIEKLIIHSIDSYTLTLHIKSVFCDSYISPEKT